MTICVGVDIGGTKIAASTVDDTGTIRHRARRETPAQDPDQIAAAVSAVVTELSGASAADGDRVEAVGVACAGLVDRSGSVVVFAPNLAWRDEPLKQRLERLIGLPVVLENDANAAAWGEYRFGAAQGTEDPMMVTLGTGVGGGIISDGEVTRGAHGMGAEIGHMRVVPDGARCGCGNKGCWEMYASGNAAEREARALVASGSLHGAVLAERCGDDPEQLTGSMVTEAAQAGDPAAIEILEDIGRWAGEGVASLVAILDPGCVVIGGGVSAAGDLVLSPARAALARHLTGRGHRPVTPIVLAALGNDSGVIGAADLAARRTR